MTLAATRPVRASAIDPRAGSIVSTVREIEPVDLVSLFGAARAAAQDAVVWLAPGGEPSMLAVGSAWRVRAVGRGRFRDVADAWNDVARSAVVDGPIDRPRATGPLLIGGFGFGDEPATTALWRGFEGASLTLPRVLVTSIGGRTWLTLNETTHDDTALALWADVRTAAALPPPASRPQGAPRVVREVPDAAEWQLAVARLAGAVGRGRLDKVVLARRIDLAADAPIDVPAVVRRLASSAVAATVFAFGTAERTFVGATPERLARVEARTFRTVAMAGSAGRGADEPDDERLAAALLASEKEREEHRIVVEMLRETLAPLADTLHVAPRPTVRRLRHVQHLVTEIEGRLHERSGVLELVERLHPTPAVGGSPTDVALELLGEQERIERGWYAGPVGWVDADGAGEFVVGIRSAVVDGVEASLFVGCGIVGDSDPAHEWQESVDKSQLMARALAGGPA